MKGKRKRGFSLYRKRSVNYMWKKLKRAFADNFFKEDPLFVQLRKSYSIATDGEVWDGFQGVE